MGNHFPLPFVHQDRLRAPCRKVPIRHSVSYHLRYRMHRLSRTWAVMHIWFTEHYDVPAEALAVGGVLCDGWSVHTDAFDCAIVDFDEPL
jgi:hypothetical protein